MKTVRQLLQSKSGKLCTIGPDASVLDALKLMAERNVGALLVVKDDKLAGIMKLVDSLDLPDDAAVEVEHQEASDAYQAALADQRRYNDQKPKRLSKSSPSLTSQTTNVSSALPEAR